MASDAPGFSAMVVDDHPLVRESMVNRLRAMGAREVVEAATIGEARARAHVSGPRELCVLDLGLPDGSGLDLLADLRAAGWQRLVVLSAADDPYSVRAAFVAGAQGYLLKSASPRRRRRRRAPGARRRRVRRPVGRLAAGRRPARRSRRHRRQRAVRPRGRGAAPGRRRPDATSRSATQLGLSALTVKSHLARIARKLGTGDRAEMVAMAMRAGVIR